MSAWIRTSLWLVIVGLALLWLTPAYRCVNNHVITESTDQATRTLSPESVHAELDKIEARNGTGKAITVTRQAKDVIRMEFLRANVKEFQPGGMGAVQRVNVLCKLMYDKALQARLDDEIRTELTRLRKGYEPEPVAWASVGHSLLNFGLWYLCFLPVMFLVYALRLTSDGRSIAWAIASVRTMPGDFIAALLIWPFGLFEYQPQTPLPQRVQEVAEALDRLRIRNPRRAPSWQRVEGAFFFRSIMPTLGQIVRPSFVRLMPRWIADCLCLVGTVFQYIWGSPDWSWCRLAVAVFRYPRVCSRAVYVTFAAIVCMIIGSVPVTMAGESAGKEKDKPLVGAVMWAYGKPIAESPPNMSLLFFLDGNREFAIYGYNTDQPLLELAQLFPVSKGRLLLNTGVYLDHNLGTGNVESFGSYSFFLLKAGDGRIGGPVYIGCTPGGKWSLFAPTLRALWPVGGGNKWKLGIGSLVSAAEGAKANILVGPQVEVRASEKLTLRMRFGEWVSGLQGQQLRFEAIISGF